MQFYRITSSQQAKDLNNKLPPIISLDCETTGLNPRKDKLLSVQIAVSESEAYFIPAQFLPLLTNIANCGLLILHNFKFDYNVLYNNGLDLTDRQFIDTLLMHHLIDENSEHSLDFLVTSIYQDNYKDVFWTKYQDMSEASDEDMLEYSCKDAIYTYRLGRMFFDKLKDKRSLVDHVHRLAKSLYLTERDGILLDWAKVEELKVEYTDKIVKLKDEMRSKMHVECSLWEMSEWKKELDKRKTERGKNGVSKPTFNFDSNKQLGELLYDLVGLPIQRNKEGNRTVDDAALAELEPKHTFIPLVREYRGAQKILSTYLQGLLDRKEDNLIYPSFNINGTVTGRISHKDPNMGNWPRDATIRQVLIPPPGYKLISADYSQIEICLAAHFSKDPILIELIKSGQSMHDYTAKVTGLTRQEAKTTNFLRIYGGTEYKLSKTLGCTIERAKVILEIVDKSYVGLRSAIDECHSKVDKGEPIVNPFGRERRFGTTFESRWDRERAKRQAFNALVQGTGADITNRSFYLMSEKLRTLNNGRALFTVHDEDLIIAREDVAEQTALLLQETMIKCGQELGLLVPLTVDCKILDRWTK